VAVVESIHVQLIKDPSSVDSGVVVSLVEYAVGDYILDRIFSFSDVLWVGDLDTATKVYVFG